MAISGGDTVAYLVHLDRNSKLQVAKGFTVSWDLCQKPEAAAAIVQGGKECIVAGSDVAQLRELLNAS